MAGQAERSTFGTLPDGRAVEAVTLRNAAGMRVRIVAWGALIQALEVPDRDGRCADVVLGHPDLQGYLDRRSYFGVTVGRYANRIAGARFTLDGTEHRLAENDGANTLHGGARGLDQRLWTIEAVGERSVTLSCLSPDGEDGFPGALEVTAVFTLGEANQLGIEYRATTDRPTIVNLTGHSYFNLAGEGSGSAIDHRLMVPAERFVPVDAALIPTGELRAVAGTPFDFRVPSAIGARIRDGREEQLLLGRGYDHTFVIAPQADGRLRLHARLEEPGSGRVLELRSDQPGLQLYSGNALDGAIAGKSGRIYRQGDGVCLEPQLFPDTPNRPAFGSARLDPGQTYRHRLAYRFSTR